MNMTLVKQLHLPMQEITLTVIQFGNSSQGSITAVAKVCFNIHGYKDKITFSVIEDLNYGLILGKPWHDHFNPTIDWKTNTISFQHQGKAMMIHPESRLTQDIQLASINQVHKAFKGTDSMMFLGFIKDSSEDSALR